MAAQYETDLETNFPASPGDLQFEQKILAQKAKLAEMNAARRLKDLPPITDPDALVENFLKYLSKFSSFATQVIKPIDPHVSEFKDGMKAKHD